MMIMVMAPEVTALVHNLSEQYTRLLLAENEKYKFCWQ